MLGNPNVLPTEYMRLESGTAQKIQGMAGGFEAEDISN
jgi:hypothetical protein